MPFLWNQGILHKHVWKCKCGFTIEFNTLKWAYREIREHKKTCSLKLASQLDRGKQHKLVLASELKVFSPRFGMEEETPAYNMKNVMEMM